MAKLKAVWTLIGALALCFVLTLGYSVTRYDELQKDNLQALENSRRYTDSRIIETQASMLAAIFDVTKTTKLLTRIICLSQFDKNECEQELGPPYKEN